MAVTMEQVKELRERTGAAILDCKKVLEQAGGDLDQALRLLKDRGLKIAEGKSDRPASEGRIETYVHPGNRVVAVVELNCETDFVGRNDAFVQLARDIALHVAGAQPKYLRKEDVPEEALQAVEVTSPEKYYEEHVLLEQPFIKQPNITINQMVLDTIAKTRENIVVRRFARWEVGA